MKRKLTALVLSLCMALSLLGVSALAVEVPGEIFQEPNGDGITPFNLQWMDKEKGIISFECEPGQFYRVEVYRDGEHIGTGGSRPFDEGMAQVNISDLLLTSGTYVFTVNHCSPPNTELDKGKMAKSEPYVFGAAAATLESPANLHFEVAEGKVYCVWDAPASWTAGRDTFEVSVENETTGWATLSMDVKEPKLALNFSEFIAPQFGGPNTSTGVYTFSVKAVSGNATAIASNPAPVQGTATYSHPDGKIVNPGGTVTPAPAPNTAYMRQQAIRVDGKDVQFQAYALKNEKGDETNYVKLRDVAGVLNGTAAQFNVGWDGSVNIETGKAYLPNGTEMTTPFTGDRVYTQATAPTNVNGATSQLAAIVLTDDAGAGYTYYKLRDLGDALGFAVGWTAETGIYLDTTT